MQDRQVVLILTEAGDEVAEFVAGKLRRIDGVDVFHFDPADFPTRADISVHLSDGSVVKTLHCEELGRLDLNTVTAVWVRRPGDPIPGSEIEFDPRVSQFVAKESHQFLDDLWNSMDCLWVPARPIVLSIADFRFTQLQRARRYGLHVPDSLFTNDPSQLTRLFRLADGQLVSKLASQMIDYTTVMRYTLPLSYPDLLDFSTVKRCPTLFQRRVAKLTEVRATVVGEQILAAEIDSQASARAHVDWRLYDYNRTVYRPHELPSGISAACIDLTQHLGLTFSAIDLIIDDCGKYNFVDLNPNGQWLWLEQMAGVAISDAVCELLSSRNGQIGEPS